MRKKSDQYAFFGFNNGIARRSWARNKGAIFAVKRAMDQNKFLKIILPNQLKDELIDRL